MVYHLIMMIIYLIDYSPLWKTMEQRNISQYYLVNNGIDYRTMHQLRNNKNIKRVIYYYYSQHEKEYIDKNFPQDIFISKSVESLWESLGYKKEKKF